MAGEFVSRFMFDRAPLPGLALGTNNSNMTAIGNDYGYNDVFLRELMALGNEGDFFMPISQAATVPIYLPPPNGQIKMDYSYWA